MKKRNKILLGAATITPMLYMIFFLLYISFVFLSPNNEQYFMTFILPMHISTMLLIFALLLIYMIDIFKNNRVQKKELWAILIFIGSVIAMIAYWYLYIWQEPEKTNQGS